MNDAKSIENIIINELKDKFNERVDDFCVIESTDIPYTMISMVFKMYEYFNVRFNYDRGRFGFVIIQGEYGRSIETTEKWLHETDFEVLFTDLKKQIELRIPDKFLEYHGWQ